MTRLQRSKNSLLLLLKELTQTSSQRIQTQSFKKLIKNDQQQKRARNIVKSKRAPNHYRTPYRMASTKIYDPISRNEKNDLKTIYTPELSI